MKKLKFDYVRYGFAIMALCFFLSNANGQVSNYKAYTLFLYNFTKYIQWPDGAIEHEFIIGVYGKSPITDELQKMGVLKKAGDKIIRVVELTEATLMQESVHILFIPEEKSSQIASVLSTLKGRPVLVVSERRGLTQKGASISFLTDNNNLRFELNSGSISAQNLKVSRALETLAFKGS
jgi:hypothetical protein